jgi:hypothetical protein
VVDAYGLKELEGSDGEVEVKEDVTEMAKGFKVGDSVQFTAVLNAVYDPDQSRPTMEVEEVEKEEEDKEEANIE